MDPEQILSSFVLTAAVVIGSCCLFAAFVRYMQYRVNPLANPISTVVTLFLIGAILLCFPWLYHVITG